MPTPISPGSPPQSRRRVQISPEPSRPSSGSTSGTSHSGGPLSSNYLMPPPLQTARRLAGRYEVAASPIGEGAFGRVYPAFDWMERREVAVKMLGRRVFDTLEEARRVLREIRLMAHFRRHPYIVDMYDVLEMPGVRSPPTLVLELMQCNLDELLTTNSRFNEGHAILFTKQILIALDVVHAANVMHRDLTTRNVLVHATEDREFHVKVCDMGLARAQPLEEEEDDALQFSRALSCAVTTRWWQAPEMLLRGRYDKSVDIWAAGCILGQMLRPHRGPESRPEEGCRRGLFKGRCTEETLGLITELLGPPPEHVLDKIGGLPFPDLEECRAPKDFAQYFQRPEGGPVSPAALHLLQCMLHLDPECRVTAHQALLHPYLFDKEDRYVRVPYREVYEPPPEDTEALPDMEAQIHAEVQALKGILKQPPVDIKRPVWRPLTPPKQSSFRWPGPRPTMVIPSPPREAAPPPLRVAVLSSPLSSAPSPSWRSGAVAPSPSRAVAPSPTRVVTPISPPPRQPTPPATIVVPIPAPEPAVHPAPEEIVREETNIAALVASLGVDTIRRPSSSGETMRSSVPRRRSPSHSHYSDFGAFGRTFPKSADDSLHQLFRQWTSFSEEHELEEENEIVREDNLSDYSLGRMETVFRDSDDDLGITRSMTEAAPLHPEVERPLTRFSGFQRSLTDAAVTSWAAVEPLTASGEGYGFRRPPFSCEEEPRPGFSPFAVS
eukprot:EG_transcript_2858